MKCGIIGVQCGIYNIQNSVDLEREQEREREGKSLLMHKCNV